MDARPNGDQPEILLHFAVAKLLREKCVWPLWSHWPSGEWRNWEVAQTLSACCATAMDARPNGDQPEILLHFAVAKLLREKCVWPLWSHWPSGENGG
jgi:hypothetical protein